MHRITLISSLFLSLACGGTSTNGPVESASNDAGTDAGTPVSQCPENDGARPSGRGEFAAGVDGVLGQMVVFGGDSGIAQNCMPAPVFEADTWIYDLACNSWKKLSVTGPSARTRTASAIDTAHHVLYLFGGRFRAGTSGAYTLYDETWAFDLTAWSWTKVATTGEKPPGLANATLTYHPTRNALLLFGGNSSTSGLTFEPHAELWSLDLTTLAWSRLDRGSSKKPAPRQFHAAALDVTGDALVVHSGGGANAYQGPFIADVWRFDLATGQWSEPNVDGAWPENRIRHVMAADPARGRMLVFGGHDDQSLGERNDLVALDLSQMRFSKVRDGDVQKGAANGFCSFPENFTTPDLQSPERRDGHFMGWDEKRGLFVMFGGKTDCGNVNDVWTLDPATDTWNRVQPTFSGESCVRSGKQGCSSLCF